MSTAELLVLREPRGDFLPGDVVVVQEGGWPWGRHEVVPPFARYSVPGEVEDYRYLTDSDTAAPRQWNLDLARLPAMDDALPGHVARISAEVLAAAIVER